jgi:hypothetical protein
MENLLALPRVYARGARFGAILIVVKSYIVRATLWAVLAIPITASHNPDERYLPATGQLSIQEVPAHVLNNGALPGGLLADYKGYQLFLIRTASAEKASFLLLDYKKTLKEPKYLPNMGGFFGADAGRPAYVFAKGVFLAGVAGLPQDKADAVARTFAARIPLK